MTSICKWLHTWRAYRRDDRGNAAAEFAIWLVLLSIPTLNVVDAGFYAFQSMQVRAAAQAAAQTAESACGYAGKTPAATSCGLTTSVLTSAIQSTSLGTKVCLGDASAVNSITGACKTATTGLPNPAEGWYCNDTSSALVFASPANATWSAVGNTATSEPTDCSATPGGGPDAPGDYVSVTVAYKYKPVFNAVSVVSLFQNPIVKTAYMRIN
jgi:hypothetical protein